MKTIKRLVIEAGTAAMIFFAANAVYAIDAIMGTNVSSARDYAMVISRGADNFRLRLSELHNMRMPGPFSVKVDKEAKVYERTFCIAPEFGSHQINLSVPKHRRALAPDGTSLPYELTVELDQGAAASDTLISEDCDVSGNVKLRVSVDDRQDMLATDLVFTDTVTLVVDPE